MSDSEAGDNDYDYDYEEEEEKQREENEHFMCKEFADYIDGVVKTEKNFFPNMH